MSPSIHFSLILCTYGRTIELERLFQSLAAQSFKDFEVIVVDQNPDARIEPFLQRACAAGITLRHVRHGVPNLSAARNIGLRHVQGAWVGFPDDDCWYEPDMLEQLSGAFLSDETLSGVVARWEELKEAAELPHRFTWAQFRGFRGRAAVSFMLFFRRSLFDRIGGFDPRLGIGQWFGAGEETDFMMRALRSGAAIESCPSAVVRHPFKQSQNTPAGRLDTRRRERGAGALYAKHRLPAMVIARGLAAPVLKPLLGGVSPGSLATGWTTAIGRWEGMLQWRQQSRRAGELVPAVVAKAGSYAAGGMPVISHEAGQSEYAATENSLNR